MQRGSKAARGILPNVRVTNALKQNRGGMVQNRPEMFLAPTEAIRTENMHATEEGSWSADKAGFETVNESGTAYEGGKQVCGAAWYVDSVFADHLVIAINGKLKEINTTTGAASDADASAGYASNADVDFQQIGDLLLSVDGSIATPRKYDGSSGGDSIGWPISDGTNTYTTPKYVEEHQGRAVYLNFQGGTNGPWPSHFALSDQDNAESFTLPATTAAHCYVSEAGVGDGAQITGAKSIHVPLTNQSQLLIFKDRSTYLLKGSSAKSGDADLFVVVKVNGNYGAISNRCILQVGNDVLAFNEFGITAFSGANTSGTIQPVAIGSDMVKAEIAKMNLTEKGKSWGVHLPDRREVWFGFPAGSSTEVNRFIVYKYPNPGDPTSTPKWSVRTDCGVFKPSCGVLVSKTFYVGFYTGIVGEMFASSLYGNSGIFWRYEYPAYDFGNEQQIKRVLQAIAHFKLRTSQMVDVKPTWKGGGNNDQDPQTLDVQTTLGGATYGTSIYGAAYYGSQEEVRHPFDVLGDGLKLKFTFSGTTNGTGPEFQGVTLITESGGLSQHYN